MSDNNSQTTNKQKEYKPSKNTKKQTIDKANIIFFVLMVFGLVFFTIILLLKSNSKVYEAKFGEDIISTVTLSGSNKIEIAVKLDEMISLQNGTYKEITDDNIDNNYLVTIDHDSNTGTDYIEHLEFIVNDDATLVLKYKDGSIIEYKEKDYE